MEAKAPVGGVNWADRIVVLTAVQGATRCLQCQLDN